MEQKNERKEGGKEYWMQGGYQCSMIGCLILFQPKGQERVEINDEKEETRGEQERGIKGISGVG